MAVARATRRIAIPYLRLRDHGVKGGILFERNADISTVEIPCGESREPNCDPWVPSESERSGIVQIKQENYPEMR